MGRVPDMEVLDKAQSHGAHFDAKSNVDASDHASSSESLIVASEAQPDFDRSYHDAAAVDSSTRQAPRLTASNGLSFSRWAKPMIGRFLLLYVLAYLHTLNFDTHSFIIEAGHAPRSLRDRHRA